MALSKKQEQQYLDLLKKEEDFYKYNKLKVFFGDQPYKNPEGKILHSRFDYPKHMNFIEAGSSYRERCFIAGNRTGKTLTGAYEMACHLTGLYPSWWTGRKFNHPISAWACGKDGKTVRDIVQHELLGPKTDLGTGMIPKNCIIGDPVSKPGVPNAIEIVRVKHVSGGTSSLLFKSYDAGVDSFVGTAMHVIWLDEECPADIYSECLIRTTTTNGILYLTFTPIHGLSDVVLRFLPGGVLPKNGQQTNYVVMVDWDSVPHLDEKTKKELLAALPAHERDARSKGVPMLGSGKIYKTPEDNFVIDPIKLPRHWPRMYGMDVGYAHPTAVAWMAWDRESDTVYLYSEHKLADAQPSSHANAILSRGAWIPGVIDTSAANTSPTDGQRLIDIYEKFGLNLYFVKKGAGSVEEGILEQSDRLESGRLKVFNTCRMWLEEYRLYRRDGNGRIVKERDDMMDATRYGLRTLRIADIEPNEEDELQKMERTPKSSVTGY